jgi:DNA-directed RNA polymerase II subunit RPB2
VYDFQDHEMMEALRPSIEEAQPIHSQQLALDYIGKRASQVCCRKGGKGGWGCL